MNRKFIRILTALGAIALLAWIGKVGYDVNAQDNANKNTAFANYEPIQLWQTNNPGWAPPGSLWVTFSNPPSLFVQTNTYNTNLTIYITNYFPVCTASCGTANALYTNYLNSVRTNFGPNSSWIPILASGTNTAPK